MINNITNKNFKNFDEKEITNFNLSADQWWKPNGIFKSLHQINTTRLNYILIHSNGNLIGKNILDVGCGGGILSESMSKKGGKVVGLDINTNVLSIAKLHAKSQNLNIRYELETIEEHALNHPNYYDIVTCMELLEHIPNPMSVIRACATVIKMGGSVFFSTINRTFKAWLLVIIGGEYILSIIPKGTHRFNKFITPSELLNWIENSDLTETNISGIYYNPITKKCILTNNVNVNYILHAQR